MPRRAACSLMLAVVVCVAASCDDERAAPPPRAPLTLTATAEAGAVPTLSLSQPLNQLGARAAAIDTLQADLELGGLDSELLHATDVAALDDGRFAVADRLDDAVRIYSPEGDPLALVRGEWPAPDAFSQPMAIAALGGRFVVWDNAAQKMFTVLEPDGRVAETAPKSVDADWMAMQVRGVRHVYDPPGLQPVEDLTRRLHGLGGSGFVHQIQPDEMWPAYRGDDFPFDGPPVYLVRYDTAGAVVDTVATSVAPPLVPREQPDIAGLLPHFDQPIYSPRPVWTAGDGWLALGHGDSTALRVRTPDGRPLLRIEWPESRREITEADRYTYADLRLQEEGRKQGEAYFRHQFPTERDVERARDEIANDLWPYSERRPQVRAAYAAGQCLWLAGFVPEDHPDGTARTWVGINVAARTLEAVVRIPRPAARVREFTRTAVYTTYVDYDWLVRLERYPLPPVDCTADGTRRAGAEHAPAIVRNAGAGAWAEEGGRWQLTDRLRIGRLDGDGPDVFGDVVDVELDNAGRLFVLDRLARKVRLFGPEGEFVRAIGGAGGGPGEFRHPTAVLWGPEGRLWVVDLRAARYTLFDTTGAYVTQYAAEGLRSLPWVGGFDRAGRFYEYDALMTPDRAVPVLVRKELAGDELVATDTFALPPPDFEGIVYPDGRTRARRPFAPEPRWHLDPDGMLWTGRTDEYRIARRTPGGDTLLIVEREDVRPGRVADELRRGARERLRRGGWAPPLEAISGVRPHFEMFVVDDRGSPG